MVKINLAEFEENDAERAAIRANRTRQAAAAMYNQNLYPQYQYTQQQPEQNARASNYPVHPDVKFKRLPFFDVVSDLLKPSSLLPQSNQRHQEGTFYFHLTPQQATVIASSMIIRPGARFEYLFQVQMRFCLLETSCEQEDYFPANVVVKVNGKLCPLPNPVPTNKPGVDPKRPPRPVNITPMVKLSPTVANTIHVSWAADYVRGYAISVALVHKRTSTDLLYRLESRGVNHSNHTRGLIKEKFNEDVDGEIATTSLRVSLICPLGKMRMTTPCRAITCPHLQCFDASLFLQMNERKPTWICPVCDKPAIYDNLAIDGYFQEVLASSKLSSETTEIQLLNDGSWTTQTNDAKPAIEVEKLPEVSIDLLSDDIEIISAGATSSTKVESSSCEKLKEGLKSREVVELTASDSDDDEPLVKRSRVLNPKPDSTNKFSEKLQTTAINNMALNAMQRSELVREPTPIAPPVVPEPTIVDPVDLDELFSEPLQEEHVASIMAIKGDDCEVEREEEDDVIVIEDTLHRSFSNDSGTSSPARPVHLHWNEHKDLCAYWHKTQNRKSEDL